MDEMVAPLRDLAEKQLFNESEIRSLISKRRDFEYLLKRRTVRKADFLQYIEYEINLLKLFKIRKSRGGKSQKPSVSDHHIEQNIHFIFVRLLRKFRSDITLWLQYVDFAKKNDSKKRLASIYAEAVQVHPRQTSIWIDAASWEFFNQGNAKGARVLLQRALRICPESKNLHLQYFALELHYVQKMRGRREVLGGSKQAGNGSDSDDANANAADLVPSLVYGNAVSLIPLDASFRLSFLSLLSQFPGNVSLRSRIESELERDFKTDPSAWLARATFRPPVGPPPNLAASIAVLDRAVGVLSTSEMYEQFANFLADDSSPQALTKLDDVLRDAEKGGVKSRRLAILHAVRLRESSSSSLGSGGLAAAVKALSAATKSFGLPGLECSDADIRKKAYDEDAALRQLWAGFIMEGGGPNSSNSGVGGDDTYAAKSVLRDGLKGLAAAPRGTAADRLNAYGSMAGQLMDIVLTTGVGGRDASAGTCSSSSEIRTEAEGVVVSALPNCQEHLATQLLRHEIAVRGREGCRYVLDFVKRRCTGGPGMWQVYWEGLDIEDVQIKRREIYENILATEECREGQLREAVLERFENEERNRGDAKKAKEITLRKKGAARGIP